jgi:hypothetical protein
MIISAIYSDFNLLPNPPYNLDMLFGTFTRNILLALGMFLEWNEKEVSLFMTGHSLLDR